MEEVGMSKNLKILMIQKEVRNFDLAKHLDIDPSVISRIINGWIDPDEELKKQIADFLGVSVASIWSEFDTEQDGTDGKK
jgi:ribosome-binding protein aMBF1 (putative translation factor)